MNRSNHFTKPVATIATIPVALMSLTACSTEQERTLTQQEIGHQVASFSNRETAAAFAQAVNGEVGQATYH